MRFCKEAVSSLVLSLFVRVTIADNSSPGYDVSSAAQVMIDKSAQSWEWGTTAEALLELYNPQLSVFGSNPFPNVAYWAVQQNDAGLMATVVAQCGLQRAVLQAGSSWQHIIGPQSQDTGLWSTGNGWACYGMVRVLHTLQKWSGSSGMTSQAGQLKGWIKEILDGAMQSGSGLLTNYLKDGSWFGEVSGTALLTACAYRMAVNDPGTFGQAYITWADKNRKAIATHQGSSGIFSPTVNPYNWKDRTQFTSGSPEGQAFTVYICLNYLERWNRTN
ncbi:hypothetical protein AA313_de0206972 [Arthrobotrys entomopaga]|nr:hypothetical protein AA313_de0206972 [Arthrobotrys entomopaga]